MGSISTQKKQSAPPDLSPAQWWSVSVSNKAGLTPEKQTELLASRLITNPSELREVAKLMIQNKGLFYSYIASHWFTDNRQEVESALYKAGKANPELLKVTRQLLRDPDLKIQSAAVALFGSLSHSTEYSAQRSFDELQRNVPTPGTLLSNFYLIRSEDENINKKAREFYRKQVDSPDYNVRFAASLALQLSSNEKDNATWAKLSDAEKVRVFKATNTFYGNGLDQDRELVKKFIASDPEKKIPYGIIDALTNSRSKPLAFEFLPSVRGGIPSKNWTELLDAAKHAKLNPEPIAEQSIKSLSTLASTERTQRLLQLAGLVGIGRESTDKLINELSVQDPKQLIQMSKSSEKLSVEQNFCLAGALIEIAKKRGELDSTFPHIMNLVNQMDARFAEETIKKIETQPLFKSENVTLLLRNEMDISPISHQLHLWLIKLAQNPKIAPLVEHALTSVPSPNDSWWKQNEGLRYALSKKISLGFNQYLNDKDCNHAFYSLQRVLEQSPKGESDVVDFLVRGIQERTIAGKSLAGAVELLAKSSKASEHTKLFIQLSAENDPEIKQFAALGIIKSSDESVKTAFEDEFAILSGDQKYSIAHSFLSGGGALSKSASVKNYVDALLSSDSAEDWRNGFVLLDLKSNHAELVKDPNLRPKIISLALQNALPEKLTEALKNSLAEPFKLITSESDSAEYEAAVAKFLSQCDPKERILYAKTAFAMTCNKPSSEVNEQLKNTLFATLGIDRQLVIFSLLNDLSLTAAAQNNALAAMSELSRPYVTTLAAKHVQLISKNWDQTVTAGNFEHRLVDEAKKRNQTVSQLLAEVLNDPKHENEIVKSYERAEAVGIKFLARIPFEERENFLAAKEKFLKGEKSTKPRTLVLIADYDHNKALHSQFEEFRQESELGNEIIMEEIRGTKDIKELIKSEKYRGKFDRVMIAGHGTTYTIHLGPADGAGGPLLTDQTAKDMGNLEAFFKDPKQGDVVLSSCDTGKFAYKSTSPIAADLRRFNFPNVKFISAPKELMYEGRLRTRLRSKEVVGVEYNGKPHLETQSD